MTVMTSIHADLPAFAGPLRGIPLRDTALHDGGDEASVDLRAAWTALLRNRVLIALVVAAALAAGAASILLTAPRYRAQASVQVDAQTAKVMNSDDLEPVIASAETERFIRTQMDILRSRTLAIAVARSLRLGENARFTDGRGERGAVATLTERLDVDLLPNSRLVRISYDDRDPVLAARIVNSFADQLIANNLQRRFGTSAYTRRFLGSQLGEAKRRLEDAERALIVYARQAHLIDASAGATRNSELAGTRSLTTANLVELNDAYAAARAARIAAEQRWNQAERASAMTLPEVLANPAIGELSQRQADLRAQYQDGRAHRKPDHPELLRLAARIAETDRQIGGIAGSIRASIRDKFAVARAQEQALDRDVAGLKEATLAEQDRGIQYNILKREVDTSRQMYDALLGRFKEVSAAAGIASNNITVVDRADTPDRPVAPRPVVNMAAATLAGLVAALLLVFGRERILDRIRDPEDVERKLQLATLGVVPTLRGKMRAQDALASPRSSFSEAHHSLCTSLSFASATGVPRSIVLTSTRPGEGKSTTAMSLAVSLARQGARVVLIDADLRRPRLHTMLNAANKAGLSHLLSGAKPLDEVVQRTELPNLFFVASGPLPPNPASLLAGAALPRLLDQLAGECDVVLIDAPPVLGLADAPTMASHVEATVFVLESDGAPTRMAARALRRLRESRARIVGLVLTKYVSAETYYESTYSLDAEDVPALLAEAA